MGALELRERERRRAPRVARTSPTGLVRPAPHRILNPANALLVALLLGVAVRAYHVLSQDFPLNDGGLFFAMVRDLQAANYHLPAITSYNAAHIPYGYSPLGLYLAGLLDDLTPLTLTEVFRWLPLVASCLLVGAFALLARSLLRSAAAAAAAVAAFAVVPRSFLWMLMGGGVTRSLGFLFALLALHQLHRVYARRSWRAVPLATLFAGLTLLSHLGTAPFLAFSAGLFMLAAGRHRHALVTSSVMAAGALAISAPWWATVLVMHGPAPFAAAAATGGSIFRDFNLGHALGVLAHAGLGTGESVLAAVGMLAVIGFFYLLARGEWLIPVWWLAIEILDARQGASFATVPVALLAGTAAIELLAPALGRRHRWAPAALLGALLLFATATALLRDPRLVGGLPDLVGLSPSERSALAWVRYGTPSDARILVVAGTSWEVDRHSEWLPVLGGRVSVATAQGYEWRPLGEFARKKREYVELQACTGWDARCLQNWSTRNAEAYTHVYIPKAPGRPCCAQLLASMRRDLNYLQIYDGAGAAVFTRAPQLASHDSSAALTR